MAREVIDLLSSPGQVIAPPRNSIISQNPPIVPLSTLPSKASKYNIPKQKKVEWYTLSSDDEISLPKGPESPQPTENPATIPSSKQITGSISTSKFPSVKTSTGDSGVFFHSDDFDTTVDLDTSVNQPQSTSMGLLGVSRKQMEEERLLRIEQRRLAEELRLHGANRSPTVSTTAFRKPSYIPSPISKHNSTNFANFSSPTTFSNKPAFDFSSLSDDLDIFDLGEDPFGSPPAKKRRVSLSPKKSPPKPMQPKVSGYQRSKSNIESSTKSNAPNPKTHLLHRASTMSKVPELDPIVFTSSPDYFADAKRRKEKRKHVSSDDEDSVFGDNSSKRKKAPIEDLNDSSSDHSLPDIYAITSKAVKKASTKSSQGALQRYETEKAVEKKRKEKEQDKLGKERAKKAAKDAKEAEKERKRIEKEEKAQEKQKTAELTQVNTLKTDKKISALEMIVHLPDSLDAKLAGQVHTFLEVHTVEHQNYESSRPIIKWQRKVVIEYNEELGYWDKVRPYIRDEKHVLYVMPAKEFVELATSEGGDDLDLHVAQLKSQFELCKLIYIIEGLDSWKRKNKTTKERQFKNAVRSHADPEEPSANPRSKKRKEADYVDEDVVEDALCKLHLLGPKVHQTEVMVVTAEWIVAFTLHISTIPYKTQLQSHDTAFCMDSGQVKTGDGAADTFVKMLQEILRITAPVAFGIVEEYPTVQALIKGFAQNGPLALEDCRKSANKDGAFTDRRVGPAISKRVYNVFMGRDPESWDV